jgi:hypothetical protein
MYCPFLSENLKRNFFLLSRIPERGDICCFFFQFFRKLLNEILFHVRKRKDRVRKFYPLSEYGIGVYENFIPFLKADVNNY